MFTIAPCSLFALRLIEPHCELPTDFALSEFPQTIKRCPRPSVGVT
jgi:hypothetical protein